MNLLGEMLMKLIMYEFKKIISSKYIMAFFAVFLIANAIICYYDISPKEYEIPQVYLNSVYDFYSDDRNCFSKSMKIFRNSMMHKHGCIWNKCKPEITHGNLINSPISMRRMDIQTRNYSISFPIRSSMSPCTLN